MVTARTADLYSTMPGSTQNPSKISFGLAQIGPKTTKKRENSVVGRSRALGDAPRTPGEASKSGPERAGTAPERSRDGPGDPKSVQDRLMELPESLRGPSGRRQDAPQERSERQSLCEQPQHRNSVVFWYGRKKAEPQFSSASAVFC